MRVFVDVIAVFHEVLLAEKRTGQRSKVVPLMQVSYVIRNVASSDKKDASTNEWFKD